MEEVAMELPTANFAVVPSSSSTASSSSSPPPILSKTYDMVVDPATDSIVSWSTGFISLVVWNVPELARDVLPKYFKHNNFSSYVRQLNTYVFVSVGSGFHSLRYGSVELLIRLGLPLWIADSIWSPGGYLHGATSLTYGVDIERMRWMGILQRISIAYAVAALYEIWLPCRRSKRVGFFRSYNLQWSLVIILSSIYFGLLYGLRVPDWEFSASDSASSLISSNQSYVYKVKCDVRGDLGPACNSAAMIDRYILGIRHLYAKPVYKNLKVYQVC